MRNKAAPAPVPTLTLKDRCDQCGAAAASTVTLPSGGTLLFCAHHTDEHRARIAELAAVVS